MKKLILSLALAFAVLGGVVTISAINSPVVADGGSCNNC
jgi:hypothetical protein